MSAYVVERETIEYLANAATGRHLLNGMGNDLTWIWNVDRDAGTFERQTIRPMEPRGRITRIGQMLWDANHDSVDSRYAETNTRAQYEDRGALHLSAPTPGNVLVTAESYERQSSQHPGYQGSEAQAYIRALIRAAYRATSDYADGEVVR